MEAIAVEVEDDVFFADLSKRISLLIMDDDEDLVPHSPSVSFEAFSQSFHPAPQTPFLNEQTCRREIKGTGVFIPRLSQPRRKSRQGRFTNTSSDSRFHRQLDKSRGLPYVPHQTNKASYDSFNPRRF